MGYPFTKPQGYYMHRRRHFTAPYPSPMGDDDTRPYPGGIFTRGVFSSPKAPWAVPTYVAREPEGVEGLGGYGGLGETVNIGGIKITCTITEMRNKLISKAVSKIPDELPWSMFKSQIKSQLTGFLRGLQESILNEAFDKANRGHSAFTAWFNTNMAPGLSTLLNNATNSKMFSPSILTGSLSKPLFDAMNDTINACRDVAPGPGIQAGSVVRNPALCASQGLVPTLLPDGKNFKCLKPTPATQPTKSISMAATFLSPAIAASLTRGNGMVYTAGLRPPLIPPVAPPVTKKSILPTVALIGGAALVAVMLLK